MAGNNYSTVEEARRLLAVVLSLVQLPTEVLRCCDSVEFIAAYDSPYFPIPFKETELGAALKAIEGCIVAALAGGPRRVTIDLEKTTAFMFQTYLAKVNGYGKLDHESKRYLKDTDLLRAQSNPYRRMSANLYATRTPNEYYHIHGSLEASATLQMLGLPPERPDLHAHNEIVSYIETRVKEHTVQELEVMNKQHRQAGVPALHYEEFLETSHGKINASIQPWTLEQLESRSSPAKLSQATEGRVLAGIKVLELCRIIAGPVMGRILAEYGADVLKVTSPKLSDVPFFQVDGNMGKHATDLDLKSANDRKIFESLLQEADVVLDGYRPGALDRLGYGAKALTDIAIKRNKGFVYVNENCFGFEGDWAYRPGWQQIADCVTGVAWEQGRFMGINEPVVPPFPISDYGTGCMGAASALIGLYKRSQHGGSWHGKTSLMHYDLLLLKAGVYPEEVQECLRKAAGQEFLSLRHHNSVEQISGAALRQFRTQHPKLFEEDLLDTWYSEKYQTEIQTVKPVAQIDGVDNSFQRASRPNGSDAPTWKFHDEGDVPKLRTQRRL